MTSTPGTRASMASARTMRCAADAPCTGARASRMRTPPRRNATFTMSWMTAPSPLVTTPITAGSTGSGRLRSAAKSPSAASFCLRRSSASRIAPRPARRAPSATSCSRPRCTYTVARPTRTTRAPSASSFRARTGAVRYITQSMLASSRSSLSVKYACPLATTRRPDTSPSTCTSSVARLDHPLEAAIELRDAEDGRLRGAPRRRLGAARRSRGGARATGATIRGKADIGRRARARRRLGARRRRLHA